MAMQVATRKFEDAEAKRVSIPLMLGLVGPSGGGKTYSALRLATGIQRVNGGDIWVIDTESKRALHYADDFKFRHIPFVAPFGPLDYLAAYEHCLKKGAKIIVTDSMSHEHEGPGGVLEMHAEETKRLAAAWRTSEDAAKMSAWQRPKAERRRMINTILQMPISSIFCFRAKEKLKIVKGQNPKPRGWMPIAGEEFIYEMTANFLLLPKAGGVPTWQSNEEGERATMKLPRQFETIFAEDRPISEDHGQSMAEWAAGGGTTPFARLLEELESAEGQAEIEPIVHKIKAAQERREINATENNALRAAYTRRMAGAPSKAHRDEEIAKRVAEERARQQAAEAEDQGPEPGVDANGDPT